MRWINQVIARVHRSEYKRGALPLLPRQIVAAYQIQRGVDDWIGTGELVARQGGERHIVVRIETGEGLRIAPMGGAEIATHQPVPVEVVHREFINVDAPAQ